MMKTHEGLAKCNTVRYKAVGDGVECGWNVY